LLRHVTTVLTHLSRLLLLFLGSSQVESYACFAGCLIDIIQTKGQGGFIAFMEVVEYEYGDLFLEITEKQPRMPPRGQTCNSSTIRNFA